MSDTFPRQHARTQRFTLGDPRNLVVSPDGARVVFARSRAGDDPVNCLWVLDAATGEFLSAGAFSPQNWTTGIDPKTGRPAIAPEAMLRTSTAGLPPAVSLAIATSASSFAMTFWYCRPKYPAGMVIVTIVARTMAMVVVVLDMLVLICFIRMGVRWPEAEKSRWI